MLLLLGVGIVLARRKPSPAEPSSEQLRMVALADELAGVAMEQAQHNFVLGYSQLVKARSMEAYTAVVREYYLSTALVLPSCRPRTTLVLP